MKRNYIKFILLAAILCITAAAEAQGRHGRPNVEDFHARKWQFIMNQVSLSPAEINAVKPVFFHYEKSVWELHQRNIDSYRKYKEIKANENINYSELNDNYINQEIKQAQLLRNYHMKLRKLLKPETLFQYYKAERMFKRRLLDHMPPPPPDEDKGKGFRE